MPPTSLFRLALATVLVGILAPTGRAQDHSAHGDHAAHMAQRTLGGAFTLSSVGGTPLPAEYPLGSGARIVGGTLDLRLVRTDSGRFTLRFTARPAGAGATQSRSGQEGTVLVRGDSLLFSPDGAEGRAPVRFTYAWTAARALDLIDENGLAWGYAPAAADTAFTAVQSRGRAVMGVDQYTSTHVFEPLADGGRIVLQRDSADAVGEATIRAHFRDIEARFRKGDFTLPGVVHGMAEVPGTKVMTARRSRIRYEYHALPRGAELRITTRDAAALEAVHAFLAFQRMDHRAGSHDHP